MERVKTKSSKFLSIFLLSFLMLSGGLYSTAARANNQAKPQLAYFVGYHSSGYVHRGPGYVYYGPRYRHKKLYWTGWRYVGHGCRKNCLVDRWSGRVIRCNRTCRR